jgi:radical SAM superfamily enzyme YgiQ (UPF0313 family)
MKTALVNLPWRNNSFAGVRAGSRWPFTSEISGEGFLKYIPFPFFLSYATALLKKKDKESKLFDAIAEGLNTEEFLERIKEYNPSLLVAETSTPSFKNDISILSAITQILPGCLIALCGPHASVFSEQILKEYHFIHYILKGEYESSVADLVEHLQKTKTLESVLGLVFRKNSRIISNNPRPLIVDLDQLPWPERLDVPIYRYNDGFCGLPSPNVQMWTSRGCAFGCIFCLWPQTMYSRHRYRKRKPVNVVDEMEYLVKKFDFKAVYFDDDIFNLDKKHVLGISKEIKKRKIKVPWAAMARADLMEDDILQNLSESGFYAVKYGIESANKKVLRFSKKNMNLDKTLSIIKLTKKLGIRVHLAFCLGLPFETEQTVEETVEFIYKSQPDSLQFSFATPFPGTEYYSYAKKNGYLMSKNFSEYDGNRGSVVRTQKLSVLELENIKNVLLNNFNLL